MDPWSRLEVPTAFRRVLHVQFKEPWPESVERSADYGEIDPVMADADVYGWAVASLRGRLTDVDRLQLSALADQVERAIPVFPQHGRPYFDRLLGLARAAVEFRLNM
ncbi:hypothetical protein B0I08_10219 [Glaciihabitans tibetensis]|uniref:Uncharacterized protein n=1 Tax=Glaciihabitans tibetensis TaxID=1266600 RepID=A0A2T0VGK5_9MICO|nr:hypothetical protein [Glaciihabitans tibetensis]PRY69347.1 hypothetical protein B0I08_10219 [Glaciihabitans tibetensis]